MYNIGIFPKITPRFQKILQKPAFALAPAGAPALPAEHGAIPRQGAPAPGREPRMQRGGCSPKPAPCEDPPPHGENHRKKRRREPRTRVTGGRRLCAGVRLCVRRRGQDLSCPADTRRKKAGKRPFTGRGAVSRPAAKEKPPHGLWGHGPSLSKSVKGAAHRTGGRRIA